MDKNRNKKLKKYLDLDYIFNKIIATNDKKFIFLILNNGTIKGIIDNKYIAILNDVLNLEK